MKKILNQTIVISNIRYIYPVLPVGKELRIAIGALSLSNQKSNASDDCHPMLAGWNENPAVEFADFQWWLKCNIEESNFIIGRKIIAFQETLSLHPEIMHGEPSVILKFKDGTILRLASRDPNKPIEVCVRGEGPHFIRDKIRKYGYTPIPFD